MYPNNGNNQPIADITRPAASLADDTTSLSSGPVDLSSTSLDDLDTPKITSRKSTKTWLRVAGIGLFAVAILAGVPLVIRSLDLSKQQNQEASLTSTDLKVQAISLPKVGAQLGASTSTQLNTLTVNGNTSIGGSVLLQPITTPTNPAAGQLFYDQKTNQVGYYDGTGFVYLNGESTVNNYSTTVNNITNQAPVTNITNITQGSDLSALNGTAGSLALFNSANTLSDSVITQSGTTLTVGGSTDDLDGATINVGTGSNNTVSIGSASNTSTTTVQAGTGGLTLNTGATSGSSGSVTIESGASSTTASGNVTIDTGSNFVTGTVIEDLGFEDGTDNMQGWTGGATVSQNCTVAHTGNCSLAMSGNVFWGILQASGTGATVVAGHHYDISAWVRAATAGTPITGALIWNVGGGFDTSYLSFPTITSTTTGWTQLTAIGTAPAGATSALFRISGTGSASNGTQYLDDLTITDLSSGSSSSELDLGGTNAQIVNIGNMNEVGPTTINGGSGINLDSGSANIDVNGGAIVIDGSGASTLSTSSGSLTLGAGGGTGGGVIVQPQSDTTTAFEVQSAEDTTLLDVDSTDNEISLGTGAGSDVGYTSQGEWDGGNSGTGSISAQRVTTTAGGTIDSISAYIGTVASPDNLYQFAIYADNGSGTAPGAYIASSAVGTLGTEAHAWYTLPVTATLAANTTYWIVYWQNWPGISGTNTTFTYDPAGSGSVEVGGSATWQAGADNGMPAAFPTVTSSVTGVVASLYASYTSSSPALTINQYGTMTQNGAALFEDPTDSTTALQVQDSLGNPLLTVDTADEIVEVSTLVVDNNITINGHIVSGGGTPTIAAGAAACTTPTVSVNGTDTSGTITVTTGTGCTANGTLANLTFSSDYSATPHITLTAGSANALSLGAYANDSSASDTGFSIGTNSTPASSTTYEWNYQAIQ